MILVVIGRTPRWRIACVYSVSLVCLAFGWCIACASSALLVYYWRINLVELWWRKIHIISYVLTSANTS